MSIKSLSTRRPLFGLTSPAFNDFLEPWSEWLTDNMTGRYLAFPKVNISETKDLYNLEVAAPGLHKTDFKIDVNGNVLTISAESEKNKEEKEEQYTRKEYNYSSFSRSFTLPDEIQQDKIEATYDGGILKLTMPKTEKNDKDGRKEISIK